MSAALSRIRISSAFDAVIATAAAVAVLFFVVPLVALVTRISPAEVATQLAAPETLTAIAVSAASVTAALVVIVLFGTPVAYLLANRAEERGALSALNVIFDLPLVLPPAVAGIALLAAFGADGPLGEPLAELGIVVPFTRFAVVLALIFVAGPLYIRQAQAAFAAVPREVVDATRVSGVGRARGFVLVELALARRGLVAGAALSCARALGEFGATIMFAGSVAGVTETITLAIYGSLETDLEASFALATLLLAITIVISALAHAFARPPKREGA